MLKCIRFVNVSERIFGPVVCGISVLAASIMVFTVVIADWFVVHMAILAPILSCLCYSDSFRELFAKTVRNTIGVCLGGFLSKLWIFIIRMVAYASTNSYNYNQYLAVAVSLPWVFAFHLLLPRRLVSATTTILVFLTLVMYSGYQDAPDAYPLRAVLSGCVGGMISLLVGYCVSRFFMKATVWPRKTECVHFSLSAYWDALIDDAISPGSACEVGKLKQDCLAAICVMNEEDQSVTLAAVRCFEILSALDWLLQSKGFVDCGRINAEGCARLIEMKSRNLFSHKTEVGISAAQSLVKASEGNIRLQAISPIMLEFAKRAIRFVSECDKSASLRRDTDLVLSSIFPVKWTPQVDKNALLKATRFSLAIIGLSQLLVFWDATDTSVDTYALWAFVPALLVTERIEYIGEAIVMGAWYLLSAFLGSGLGVISLLLSQAGRQSFLGEFIIILLIGLTVQSRRNQYGDSGLVFIFSWIICVLGNLGLDPSSDFVPPSGPNALNILWRIALYRSAITCFAVFAMALSFVIIPAPTAKSTMHAQAHAVVDRACRAAAAAVKSTASDREVDANIQYEDFLTSVLREYVTLQRWANAECLKNRNPAPDPSKISDLIIAVSAVMGGIGASDNSLSPGDYEPVVNLNDANLRLGQALGSRDGYQLRERTKEVRESYLKAKKWMLESQDLNIETQHVNTLVVADLLAEVVRKTLPLSAEADGALTLEPTLDNV